jgi:hypothetical protein
MCRGLCGDLLYGVVANVALVLEHTDLELEVLHCTWWSCLLNLTSTSERYDTRSRAL